MLVGIGYGCSDGTIAPLVVFCGQELTTQMRAMWITLGLENKMLAFLIAFGYGLQLSAARRMEMSRCCEKAILSTKFIYRLISR